MSQDIEYALRVCESVAFTLHSTMRLTEPCHGILGRYLAKNAIPYPEIFFPIVGLLGLVVAYVNMEFGHDDAVILGAQAYVASYHTGAVFTHLRYCILWLCFFFLCAV